MNLQTVDILIPMRHTTGNIKEKHREHKGETYFKNAGEVARFYQAKGTEHKLLLYGVRSLFCVIFLDILPCHTQ